LSGHKLFPPEWNALALEAVNASKAMYDGFKDPATFTHKMEFGCTDRDLRSHLEWEQAKVVSWTEPRFDRSELYLVIAGPCFSPGRSSSGRARCRLPSRTAARSTTSSCPGIRCLPTGMHDPPVTATRPDHH
jgi:hypothetical protein